jgi:hypothetical protein
MLRRFFLILPLIFLGGVSFAKAKTPAQSAGDLVRHIEKGTSITVNGFEEKTGAFLLTINSEPAVGPNYATPEELQKAIDFDSDAAAMVKRKDQIIGSEYQLKKPLLLLTENELVRRRARK